MATLLTNATLIAGLNLPATILTALNAADKETYEPAANTFISALVNKICMQKVEVMEAIDNPFKKYDGEPITYGDTIENVGIEYSQGEVYDENAANPYEVKKPTNVKVQYASMNYKMIYWASVYKQQLRQAVLSEYGLMRIANGLVETLNTSKDGDEYQAQIAFLDNSAIYAKGIEELTKGSDDVATAKIVTKKIIDVVSDFKLPCADNNKLGFKLQKTSPNNCILVIKQSLLNSINTDFLTGVFNLSKVEIGANIIPIRDFKVTSVDSENKPISYGNDIDFIVLDSRGFDNHVALQEADTMYNGRNMCTNTFVHLWKVFGFKLWHNARAFKLVAAH